MTVTIYKNTRKKNNSNSYGKKFVLIFKLMITKPMLFLDLNLPTEYFVSLLENTHTFEILSLILVKTVNSGRLHPHVLVRQHLEYKADTYVSKRQIPCLEHDMVRSNIHKCSLSLSFYTAYNLIGIQKQRNNNVHQAIQQKTFRAKMLTQMYA